MISTLSPAPRPLSLVGSTVSVPLVTEAVLAGRV